jgi:hypothetical protein
MRRAGAVTNACTNGMFPNQPGSNSALSIACTLTTATGGAGNAYSIEDFPEAVWHRGAARLSAADGVLGRAVDLVAQPERRSHERPDRFVLGVVFSAVSRKRATTSPQTCTR